LLFLNNWSRTETNEYTVKKQHISLITDEGYNPYAFIEVMKILDEASAGKEYLNFKVHILVRPIEYKKLKLQLSQMDINNSFKLL